MSFHERRILPHLVHLSMQQATFVAYRNRVVPAAEGRVLEIGGGLNLPFYADRATEVIGLDPLPTLLSMAGQKTVPASFTSRVLLALHNLDCPGSLGST